MHLDWGFCLVQGDIVKWGILSWGGLYGEGCAWGIMSWYLLTDYLFHTYYYLSSYAFHANPCILSSPCHCASCQPNNLYIYVYIITYPINLIIYNLPSKSLLHHLKTVSDRYCPLVTNLTNFHPMSPCWHFLLWYFMFTYNRKWLFISCYTWWVPA